MIKIYFTKEKPRCKRDLLPYIAFCGSRHFWNLFIGVIFGCITIFYAAKDWMVKGKENNYVVYSRNPKYKDEELIMWPNPKARKN